MYLMSTPKKKREWKEIENDLLYVDYYSPKYPKTEDVAYWRKANAIHKWFVDNCQNGEDECGYGLVTKQHIIDLLHTCQKDNNELRMAKKIFKTEKDYKNENYTYIVYDTNDLKETMDLLPSQSGFFFGDTEYNEWYKVDIEETIDICINILLTFDFDKNYLFYHSSW